MNTGAEVAKRFYKELTDIQVLLHVIIMCMNSGVCVRVCMCACVCVRVCVCESE